MRIKYNIHDFNCAATHKNIMDSRSIHTKTKIDKIQ